MQKQTLLLIHPPQCGLMEGFASGLISLANYISAHAPEVDVRLVDLGLVSIKDLRPALMGVVNCLAGENPTTAGITTTTATYQAALRVAETLKALIPATVVFGGHHATPEADIVLAHHKEVDFVIAGEGEAALLEFLVGTGERKDAPSLIGRGRLGVVRSAAPPVLLDQFALDAIPPTYRGDGLRSAPGKFDHVTYISARGCPLKCAFCAVANERIRHKSVGAVIRDLRYLVEEGNFTKIALEDNFFAQSPKRTMELCRALKDLRRSAPFTWDCQTRAESMARPALVEAMDAAGCDGVYLGVEALHPELLLHLRKTLAPEKYLNTLTSVVVPQLLTTSIECYLNLQFGIPGETHEHREVTLRLLGDLGRAAHQVGRVITVFPQLAVLYPGTAHHADAVRERRFGYQSKEIFEGFTEWEAMRKPILEWLGATFAHGTGGLPEGILDEGELRRGRFDVDGQAVLTIQRYICDIEELPGIRIFKYDAFLAGPNRSQRNVSTLDA